ncbi:DarT1-associated NADAR antitoxin family protein [Peribacillus simplex]
MEEVIINIGGMVYLMAERPVFIANIDRKDFVEKRNIEFEWFPGFSIKQKQKSVQSLHENINEKYPILKVLEVSSKSDCKLGFELSAFNLMVIGKNNAAFSVESAFQASKVFEFGGPFVDLYQKNSREAKKDTRIRNSGRLLYFQFFSRKFELEPKTLFYDWLYINALYLNKELSNQVVEYDAFTDIEFNPQKSINCQARAAALFVSLYKLKLLDRAVTSVEDYKEIVTREIVEKNTNKEKAEMQQLSFFNTIMDE